jgi:spore coat polysaccharide biosynthesis predicted glycosyltransferase SpsG
VLVTMGGSDPCGLTLQALRALDSMPESFEIVIAVGPAFMHEAELATWCGVARHKYRVKRENSLLDLMVGSDVAVVSFGTTVYELAATGLPAVALSISEDHLHSAEVFARHGSMISLGLSSSVDDASIQDAVRRLLSDRALWSAMAKRGQEAVDGRGAERVAALLLARIHRERKSRAEDGIGKSQRA